MKHLGAAAVAILDAIEERDGHVIRGLDPAKPLSINSAEKAWQRLRERAGIPDGRLHDLRHTFAVNCLTEWYRAGADVQKFLPYLSTYLGHKNLSGTRFYLSMTRELLDEASKPFEQSFLGTADEWSH